jgi:hypothetical protein
MPLPLLNPRNFAVYADFVFMLSEFNLIAVVPQRLHTQAQPDLVGNKPLQSRTFQL